MSSELIAMRQTNKCAVQCLSALINEPLISLDERSRPLLKFRAMQSDTQTDATSSRIGTRRLRVIYFSALTPVLLWISGCAAVLADLDRPLPTSHVPLLSSYNLVNPPRTPDESSKQAQTTTTSAAVPEKNGTHSKQKTQATPKNTNAVSQKVSFGAVVFNPSGYSYASYGISPRRNSVRPSERFRAPRNQSARNFFERPFDVWERIRRGFAMPELNTTAADRSTNWYAAQPASIERMTQRAVPYLFHIVEEIEKRGMPTELALLPFVESAMQPQARSSANAVGLWQFIPSTGRHYDLEQNVWHDQRSHITESTRAALDYLEKLFDDFGDWHLALAAYNCGEGCVQRALNRARSQGNAQPVYEELNLPNETLDYVPKLQAIKNIVRSPEGFGIALPIIKNEPYFVVIPKTRDIDIATAALLAEMTEEEFRTLNPAFKRPIIVGAAGSPILLPADREKIFHTNLAAWEAAKLPLASWGAGIPKAPETVADIALRMGASEAAAGRTTHRTPQRSTTDATLRAPRTN